MSIFSLFIGNNNPSVRKNGKRTKAKTLLNKDSVIALKLYYDYNPIVSYNMSRISYTQPWKTKLHSTL